MIGHNHPGMILYDFHGYKSYTMNVAASSRPKKIKKSVEHEHPRAIISVTMDDALTAPPR